MRNHKSMMGILLGAAVLGMAVTALASIRKSEIEMKTWRESK